MRLFQSFRSSRLHRRPSLATWAISMVTVVIVGSLLAGCSSAPAAENAPASVANSGPAGIAAAPPSAPAAAPAASAPPSRAAAAAKPSAPATAGQASNGTSTNLPALDRMVIRNAKLSLQVQNVEAALQKVRDVADLGGGYVTASHTYLVKDGDQDRMVADVTIAVRSDAYDRSVESIRQVATKVESEDGTSQDVTEEYVDLQANLRNLQASEDSLLKLTQQATKLDDILTLERELANVRGQIERIQGRMHFIEHSTDMSTIAINLHLPPVQVAPVNGPVWNPVATFERGWKASVVAVETLADVLIIVVSFFWWLIPFGAAGVYLLRRNRRTGPTVSPPA